jgi:hypothetical protein
MSYNVDFSIRAIAARRARLKELRGYLEAKKSLCDQLEGIVTDDQLLELGLAFVSDVVTWGFCWQPIRQYKGGGIYYMDGTAWANQNAMNIHISGRAGELARTALIFPDIDWEVSFSDEFGQYGECRHPHFEMDIEGWREGEEEE